MALSIQQNLGTLVMVMTAIGVGLTAVNDTNFQQQGKSVLGGNYQRGFESDFKQNVPFQNLSKQAWNAVRLGLLNETHSEVIHTDGGWFFTVEEFVAPQTKFAFPKQLEIALANLSVKNITLIPIIIPDKSRIYADQLPHARLAAIEARYGDALDVLASQQVPAIDLRSGLLAAKETLEPFLRTDTHWSPRGAQIVADVVVGYLPTAVLGETTFKTTWGDPQSFSGDLLTFVDTGVFADWVGPDAEIISVAQSEAEKNSMSLFSNVSIPITLVGTSFSAKEMFNFAGFLRKSTGSDVLNVAQEGHGPFLPMAEYLASEDFQKSPPKLIIWEIPERYIAIKEFDQ